ncbi:MAG: hypothetical protein KDD69_14640 [Bdellovibrionales bacterium]|nr:hypothetical protein [Bdellovibrionales bacterium]
MNPIGALLVLILGFGYIFFEDQLRLEFSVMEPQQLLSFAAIAFVAFSIGYLLKD